MVERHPVLRAQGREDWASDLTILPLLHARALPGGVIERAAYEALRDEIRRGLELAMPLDAVFLDLHGAMHVEGLEDAEADFAGVVRAVVGREALLGASMDLHGNVSAELVGLVDLFSAYRTAPHEDEEDTRDRVWRMLGDCLRGVRRPVRVWAPVPVLLPGEKTSTQAEPGRSLFASLEARQRAAGLLDLSLWVGYAWEDAPRASAAVVATGFDGPAARQAAGEMAQAYWDQRENFVFSTPSGSLNEAVAWVLEQGDRPLFVCDSGDNPTAGGLGSLVQASGVFLDSSEEWIRRERAVTVAGLWAPDAVARCFSAGIGSILEVEAGYSGAENYAGKRRIRGKVVALHEGDPWARRQAVLDCGPVRLCLTEGRKPFHSCDDFRILGIDPRGLDVVVVKMGYLVPEFHALAAGAFLALTPGPVNQDIEGLSYKRLRRPLWPLDREMVWRAEPRVFAGESVGA